MILQFDPNQDFQLEAINAIAERYRQAGKNLRLRHLSADCRGMLEKAGAMVDVEVLPDDPAYTVARLRRDAKVDSPRSAVT